MDRDDASTPAKEKETAHGWKGLVRDVVVAVVVVVVVIAGLFVYAGLWPPIVVVESSSMQHADRESFLGVIDTGDMVIQQAATTRESVVTYVQGRANGHATYGDFGDVIIFRRPGNPTPVIHRAIMYITLNGNGTADVPDLAGLPASEWGATNATGVPTQETVALASVTIRNAGFERNINLTFIFSRWGVTRQGSGYVTMGDQNVFLACQLDRSSCTNGYDTNWLPRIQDVQGRARGELPWFGLIKLTLGPTDACCAGGWADPEAPKNSWDALAISLIGLVALPFLLELGGRGWSKYVSPKLPPIRWPWRRRVAKGTDETRDADARDGQAMEADSPEEERSEFDPESEGPTDGPPREGSSGP